MLCRCRKEFATSLLTEPALFECFSRALCPALFGSAANVPVSLESLTSSRADEHRRAAIAAFAQQGVVR